MAVSDVDSKATCVTTRQSSGVRLGATSDVGSDYKNSPCDESASILRKPLM